MHEYTGDFFSYQGKKPDNFTNKLGFYEHKYSAHRSKSLMYMFKQNKKRLHVFE